MIGPSAQRPSPQQRQTQLRTLLGALDALTAGLAAEGRYLEALPEYETYRQDVATLLERDFAQADLDRLALAVPQLFWLHKEWDPPVEELRPGERSEPAWFRRLASLEERVRELAFALRVVGTYGG